MASSCFITSCTRKPVLTLTYSKRTYCKGCFLELIGTRFRKELRTKAIDATKQFVLLDDGSAAHALATHLLSSVFGKRLKLKQAGCAGKDQEKSIKKIVSAAKSVELVLVPKSMDTSMTNVFERFIANRKLKTRSRLVIVLDSLLDEEIVHAARLLRLETHRAKQGRRNGREHNSIQQNSVEQNSVQHINPLIEAIERRHPGTRFSLKKSLDALAEVE